MQQNAVFLCGIYLLRLRYLDHDEAEWLETASSYTSDHIHFSFSFAFIPLSRLWEVLILENKDKLYFC